MSIDVLRVCPVHGQTDHYVNFGGRDFCSRCLGDKLAALGVSEVTMTTIDREEVISGPQVTCECCGVQRTHTQNACPICGYHRQKAP